MKLTTTLLPLAALTSAFVIPDEQITQALISESQEGSKIWIDHLADSKDDFFAQVEEAFGDAVAFGENAIDNAINAASDISSKAHTFECHHSMTKFDAQGWLDSTVNTVEDLDFDIFDTDRPHKKPKHGKKPHHGPSHTKSNKSVYELIASSKYTTKLAKLINEYPDLVETLNGTAANYTIFAPTDKAFEKIPHHGDHKPSKELIKKVLAYHVAPDLYHAGRVLVSHTIPTAVGEEGLGGNPQRLRVGVGLRGVTVNHYSRVIAVDIFGSNGVIHGVDSILFPPPPALKILSLLPGEFSTLLLALEKTSLNSAISNEYHEGGTLFAPSNWAFRKLGYRANAFLFSPPGEKFLKALLKYHVVANQTLYSDAFYKAKSTSLPGKEEKEISELGEVEEGSIPKGRFHIDLPTLLGDKSLAIDVARWGGFISMKINGRSSISTQDGIAKDGVIHVVSSILFPPKTVGGKAVHWEGEEMSVDELRERLGEWVEEERNEEL